MSPDADPRHVIEVHDCPACHMRPGSATARAKGCVCPVMDNGRGHNPYRLIVNEGCPVHRPPLTPEIDKHARTVLARRLVAQHEVGR